MRLPINTGWSFFREESPTERVDIELPHTFQEIPTQYFDPKCMQFVGVYEKELEIPADWRGCSVSVCFYAAAHRAKVNLNGHFVGEHKGGYTAFRIELTDYLAYGRSNLLRVEVDSRSSLNIPPFGGAIDYITCGGLYREAELEIRSLQHIRDTFVHGDAEGNFYAQVTVNQPSEISRIAYSVLKEGSEVYFKETEALRIEGKLENVQLWSPDAPNLYTICVSLISNGQELDTATARFGFRTARFQADGFYLNGERLKLIGLNRHQLYPYVGYAMPWRAQREDARILKQELCVNAVRTAHYPQSIHFVDACDELGLLVFTEIPGWQHIGDAEWQQIAIQYTEEMVLQYRNHPSIVLWGVRINESQDCDPLYAETNRIAHALDPTRQTGGVRYIKGSRLIEDVYTFNDFTYSGGKDVLQKKHSVTKAAQNGYLVTEFNGHMYPTKRQDSAARRQEHALRHSTVLNQIKADPQIAGGFGWCFADYNTHDDFGSGDNLCHHGVMDIFRNPKPAASAYRVEGAKVPVLEVITSLHIGDWDRSALEEIVVYTNADSVRLSVDGRVIQTFGADRNHYKALLHPPMILDDLIGDRLIREEGFSRPGSALAKAAIKRLKKRGWNNIGVLDALRILLVMLLERKNMVQLTQIVTKIAAGWGGKMPVFCFEAMKDGQVVASTVFGEAHAKDLVIDVNTKTLTIGTTYDVASVRITAVDQYGHLLPYFTGALTLRTEGPIQVLGPTVFALTGGAGATYVRTTGLTGLASLTICSDVFDEKRLDFEITRSQTGINSD